MAFQNIAPARRKAAEIKVVASEDHVNDLLACGGTCSQ